MGSGSLSFCSTSSFPYGKSGIIVTVDRMTRDKRRSSISTDQPSIPFISVACDNKPNFKVEGYSHSNTVAPSESSVESFDVFKMQGQSALLVGIMPTVPPLSVPPHSPDKIISTMRAYSGV